MKKILIILLLLLCHFSYAHDIKMAVFEITESGNGYALDISFDKLELEKSLITAYPELLTMNDNERRERFIIEYLEGNFQMMFNGSCVSPEIHSVSYERDYVRVHATVVRHFTDIKTIDVFNTCLIDYNKGHLNIIKVSLHDRVRTFRLSADRIRTTIDYQENQ